MFVLMPSVYGQQPKDVRHPERGSRDVKRRFITYRDDCILARYHCRRQSQHPGDSRVFQLDMKALPIYLAICTADPERYERCHLIDNGSFALGSKTVQRQVLVFMTPPGL